MLVVTLRKAHLDASELKSKVGAWRTFGRGLALQDATVGIIGCGHIGLETAKLVRSCGGNVLLWNRSWLPKQVTLHNPDVFKRVLTLKELARRCDAVSVHVSLTDTTKNLIGREFFTEVKRSGRSIVLVNTSRGKVINERELLRAIKSGIVQSAAIDVWSHEGKKKTDPTTRALRTHPSVFASSHIAAYTFGIRDRFALQCAHNVVALVEGRRLEVKQFIVNPQTC